jgi:hypothetical protein
MRLFITRAGLFIVATMSLFLVALFAVPSALEREPTVAPQLAEKLSQCEIIVAGDSRAARQVDPAVIFHETGKNAINIGESASDCYRLSEALKLSGISGKTIIVSVSFFQVNDGAIDPGYFSAEAFQQLSLADKLALYRTKPDALLMNQSALFQKVLNGDLNTSNVGAVNNQVNVQYEMQPCKSFTADEEWFRRHKWYKSPSIDGYKMKPFMKALKNLASLSNCRVILYNGPVSQSFMDVAKANGVYQVERSFDELMKKECASLGLEFHSFLDDESLRSPSFYYDPQHLCGGIGTTTFTKKLVDLIR